MKKIAALLVALVMMLSMTAVAEGTTELTYWSMWSSTEPQAIAIQKIIDEYTAATGVKVNVEWMGRDIKTTIETAIDAGEKVDLFDDDFQRVSQQLGGKLTDLEEMAKAVNYDDFAIAALPAAVRGWASSLKAIPYQSYSSGILYNVEMFEAAGIEAAPATWEELLAACEKLKAAGYAPFAQDDAYVRYTYGFLLARYIGQDAVKELVINGDWAENEGALKAAQRIEELHTLGYLSDEVPGTYPASQNGLGFGTTAMVVCATWVPNEVLTNTEYTGTIGMYNFPSVEGGVDPNTYANIGAQAFGIPATSENAQAAFDLIMAIVSGTGDSMLAMETNSLPCDTRNTEWPELLAGCKDAVNAQTGVYDWNMGLGENADIDATLQTNLLKLFEGGFTAQQFIDAMEEASK
ncbi:MAG: ABC transporter substrate-binding protein [Eubacteriales bacterium]|nr:ABC transporter substrate-binding protein [Eubacteriales bacterium]